MQTASVTAMPMRLKLSIAAYIVAFHMGSTIALLHVWPGAATSATLPLETRFLLMAALAGALGSYIHLASSFIEHAGQRALHADWAWWYFLRPLVGSALALIVYFVVRAGLISGVSDTQVNINPYGVAALSALSGMFSKQATEKLREVFENFCALRAKQLEEKSERVDEPQVG